MKKKIYLLVGLFSLPIVAQTIEMHFPYFKGNTYDFIIFQGSKNIKVVENAIIPENGRFSLVVPQEHAPYTGMASWVITNSQQDGGLELVIPGYDFSISCLESAPTEDNIKFINNAQLLDINNYYQTQQSIFAKLDVMLKATQVFSNNEKNYSVFQNLYQNQLKAYELYQHELKKKNNYASQYINFINVSQGLGTKIYIDEISRATNIADYINNQLDWSKLYTSGYWSNVIGTWVSIYANLFNDPQQFAVAFNTISNKFVTTNQYTDFVKLVTTHLTQLGKDDFIKTITPIVVFSGKIEKFDDVLAVYISAKENEIAPSLVFSDNNVVHAKDFANENYEKTLVVFYQSDCENCQELMNNLKEQYNNFSTNKVRIISVSSDSDFETFNKYAVLFPWQDVIYDLDLQNANFKNYGVVGTPTFFLIDKKGEIIARGATLQEIKLSL